jgi:phenylpyruvate tautomerase PptA (4-oxalocrotonate tautomerase family)
MPLVRIDMFGGKPTVYRLAIADAVCEALGDVMGVAAEDCHRVVIDHEPDNQNNLTNHFGVQRNSDAILVTIEFNQEVGIDQKGLLYTAIVRALRQRMGLPSKEVALKLVEVGGQGPSATSGSTWTRCRDECGTSR